MYRLLREEENFYKDYHWCLDPMQKWGAMRSLLLAELERWAGISKGWQERELTLNCWLMGSALWQAMSDYTVRGSASLDRTGFIGPFVGARRAFRSLNGTAVRLRNLTFDRPLAKRDGNWRGLLLRLSRCLIDEGPASNEEKRAIRRLAEELLSFGYPAGLRESRIKIPSLFRSEDITHHDILRLLSEYAAGDRDRHRPVVIVGLRTAGSYLAPLAHAYLERGGFPVIDSVTLRPGGCLSTVEQETLARGKPQNAEYLIISEPPRTGRSIAGALERLQRLGIAEERIAVLFPAYPANEQWKQCAWARQLQGVRVHVLPWNRWFVSEYLKSAGVRKVLDDYFAAQEMQLVGLEETCKSKCIDTRFGRPERIGWRLKQTYRAKLWDRNGRESYRSLLAKSVGWGWLGYHAYIQADRLSGFVPPVLGLRSGVIFMDWIEGKSCKGPEMDVRQVIPQVLEYIFARMDRLSLPEDMTFREDSPKYYGGQFLVAILARVYGRRLGALVRPLLRRVLKGYAAKQPTAIDGKIAPEECIIAGGRLWKVDYEHHGFGSTELNVADPVFDLASFIFEFRLDEGQREQVLGAYVSRTGDRTARDKIILYLWLIAHYNLGNERSYLSETLLFRRSIEENRKYVSDRAYSSLLSMEYFTRLVRAEPPRRRNRNYFVMDVDGVLDREIWDFPTTTISGIRAIALLRRHGFPVFINTARGLQDVRAYCEYFGLEGGIAEYGSALWDHAARRLTVLADRETQDELREMKRLVLELPEVYINSQCRYSIRAFRHASRGTKPIELEKVQRLISLRGFTRLKAFSSGTDTVIMARSLDKGVGMEQLFARRSERPERVIAVGYADSDIPMFLRSDVSFAPKELIARVAGASGRSALFAVPKYQAGLFDAARTAVRKYCRDRDLREDGIPAGRGNLMVELITVADRRRLGKLFSLVTGLWPNI